MKERRGKREIIIGVILLIIIATIGIGMIYVKKKDENASNAVIMEKWLMKQGVSKQLLTPNEYSRPGYKLEKVTGVVIHYTGNPGTSALNNRNYFESLKTTKTTYASSHFIIGLEGEIIQCIPLTEQSFCNKTRNMDTITIECCHPDEEGKFNHLTYEAIVTLTSKICEQYELNEDQILRHYDITGKLCPKYYVEHEEAWNKLKHDIVENISSQDEE